MPSRPGGTLNVADSFGYMFVSNWSLKYSTSASVITVRSPFRQSDAAGSSFTPGALPKSRSFATQISECAPTARSVYDFR